eukprot:512084-Rhodomonas_salina.1
MEGRRRRRERRRNDRRRVAHNTMITWTFLSTTDLKALQTLTRTQNLLVFHESYRVSREREDSGGERALALQQGFLSGPSQLPLSTLGTLLSQKSTFVYWKLRSHKEIVQLCSYAPLLLILGGVGNSVSWELGARIFNA